MPVILRNFVMLFPGCIYTTKYVPEFFDEMMFDIYNLDKSDIGDDDEDTEYVVFRIDTNKFSKFNIFRDNMAGGPPAVYTLSHIPAKAISVYEYRSTNLIENLLEVKLDDLLELKTR